MRKINVTVEFADENYAAYIEKLPGCVSTGKTFEELKSNIDEAVQFHLDGMREDNEKIPTDFLGEFKLSFHFISIHKVYCNTTMEYLQMLL